MPDITFPTHMPPVAGVDIGGTKVAVSVADGRGVRGKLSQPTAVRGGRDALALQVVAQMQKKGGTAAFVDAEHALDPQYAANKKYLRGKGGFALTKFQHVETKLDPVFEELLVHYPLRTPSPSKP